MVFVIVCVDNSHDIFIKHFFFKLKQTIGMPKNDMALFDKINNLSKAFVNTLPDFVSLLLIFVVNPGNKILKANTIYLSFLNQ